MLSEFQQQAVWDGWLSAEIRSGYFAELVTRYQARQRYLVVGGLLLSSGATVTLLTTVVPPAYAWIKPLLTVLAALTSLWSLVAKNERNAIDCADLHLRWNNLAAEYEAIWANVYADDAEARLAQVRKEESLLSKSSTSMPRYDRLLAKVQDNVMMHHRSEVTA